MKHVDVAIVGGGITGLAAAHHLTELGRERGLDLRLVLLEEAQRLGGPILTERRDGLLLEGGPDQFVQHKPAGVALCRRLGLERELVEIDARRAATHVVRSGRAVALPRGFSLLGPSRLVPLFRSPLVSWRGALRVAAEPFIPARDGARGDESLEAFVTRRFGRELYERVYEPIVAGIFTADGGRLSLEMAAPQLAELERRHGSVVRALRRRGAEAPAPRGGCVALSSGMGRLVERLVERLPERSLRRGSPVLRVSPDGNGTSFRLSLASGETIDAATLILASPAHASARLVDFEPELARQLGTLDHASCATVNLVYEAGAMGLSSDAFGFFVGRAERLPILAVSHVGAKFPERVPAGRVALRAFLGGARDPELLTLDDDALADLAHRAVAGLLRITRAPLWARVHRFPRSMPQYDVGFRVRLDALRERERRLPGLFLAGGAVGALGIPDCVASGERAAASAFSHAAARAAPCLAASRA